MACHLQLHHACGVHGRQSPRPGGPEPGNQVLGACILHGRLVVCAHCPTILAQSNDRYSPRTTHDEASSPRARCSSTTEAPLTIRTRFIPFLWAIALLPALVLGSSVPARAAMGPDMPAWTIQPYSDHDQDKDSESSSEATQVSDTLERTLANVAKAEDLVDAGKKEEAQSAIQAALLSLDGVSRDEPGVKQVREKLDDLRERCDRMSGSNDPLATDDGA